MVRRLIWTPQLCASLRCMKASPLLARNNVCSWPPANLAIVCQHHPHTPHTELACLACNWQFIRIHIVDDEEYEKAESFSIELDEPYIIKKGSGE
ncbi:hypothetical protein BaRGS_00003767 [Batillaria attramentaria]|uniref:Secreted protein n=1 Tax=Batillaria attramentaria TaxID=370345 RepID=A0ABD0LYH3_9CAEN